MLFNSYSFLFIFLPISLIIFYLISLINRKQITIISIIISSLIFYSVHNLNYLYLFIFSITVNYYFGYALSKSVNKKNKSRQLFFLKTGVIFNILLLFIFKYFNFFIDNLTFFGINLPQFDILLPIGISFYTFQQIGFLVDIYKEDSKICNFFEYASFVSFFPQLIAGPIVHHADFLNQIRSSKYKPNDNNKISLGIIIFIFGLFKKIIIADTLSLRIVEPFYNYLAKGNEASILTAWIGTFSYTMQIYFDFSAYSEMAIGLGLLYGITLPINFNSPFQSHSLIDYWGRWNITLSNFISSYVYLPIFQKISNNSRKFFTNHLVSIFIAMTISGLWHGASWNFVLWGIIHGIALALNHLLKVKKIFLQMPIYLKRIILMIFINTSFVLFKVSDLSLIKSVIFSLFNIKKILNLDLRGLFDLQISFNLNHLIFFVLISIIVLFCPSTLNILGYQSIDKKINLKNSIFKKYKFDKLLTINLSIILSICFLICVIYIHRQNDFIYYQYYENILL